jgi:hypothetical protein
MIFTSCDHGVTAIRMWRHCDKLIRLSFGGSTIRHNQQQPSGEYASHAMNGALMNSTARPRRILAVQWLRRTHGWIGLWGATLGLLFGLSGIWLNHRSILKLPVAQQRVNTQIALPDPAPADAAALAVWLQTALKLDAPASSVKTDAARPVAWAEKSAKGDMASPVLMQPEHWTITYGGPRHSVQAETWAGNRSVSVRTLDNGLMGTLTNLHKGTGMTVPWILLVDTLAGSLILLSLSGLTLWALTHRKRVVGGAIFGTALAVTAGLAISSL